MEIIKSEKSSLRKCEYGDFELNPEEGWKISRTFIDYESGLLVVSVSIIDESKWINRGYDGRIIPTREYKIDLKTLSILKPEEWQKYFSYDEVETISEDKKYKLISRRIFDPERGIDSYKEELYDLISGELVSRGHSIAFTKEKRETLLESFLRSVREKEKQKAILDAKPTLEQFYVKQVGQLTDNDIIIYYYDNQNVFQLKYSDKRFLLSGGGQLPADYTKWKVMTFNLIKSYDSADDFWSDFITDKKWYLKFNYMNGQGLLSSKVLVLAKHIITFFNEVRRKLDFTYAEYEKINKWSTLVWSEEYKGTEIKQWCSNCFKEVYYQPRYPKYICSDCFSKNKFDENGNLLEFSNLGFSGGFRITYLDNNGVTLREDDTQEYGECLIDGKLFFAQEARLGGIVIQRKD
jgi:hypothetical protein